MFSKILDAFFGCVHGRYSFPLTVRPGLRRNTAASLTGTYVVCLDCGKELAYDWNEMKIVNPSSNGRSAVRELASKHAA